MLGIMYIQTQGQPALGKIFSNKYEGHGVYASGVTQEARLYSYPAQRAQHRRTALIGLQGGGAP